MGKVIICSSLLFFTLLLLLLTQASLPCLPYPYVSTNAVRDVLFCSRWIGLAGPAMSSLTLLQETGSIGHGVEIVGMHFLHFKKTTYHLLLASRLGDSISPVCAGEHATPPTRNAESSFGHLCARRFQQRADAARINRPQRVVLHILRRGSRTFVLVSGSC
jgi:hypothetical protein